MNLKILVFTCVVLLSGCATKPPDTGDKPAPPTPTQSTDSLLKRSGEVRDGAKPLLAY